MNMKNLFQGFRSRNKSRLGHDFFELYDEGGMDTGATIEFEAGREPAKLGEPRVAHGTHGYPILDSDEKEIGEAVLTPELAKLVEDGGFDLGKTVSLLRGEKAKPKPKQKKATPRPAPRKGRTLMRL